MKIFFGLMKHPPNTILTNQDPWLTEATAKELSRTKHGFCIWHITIDLAIETIEQNEARDTMLATCKNASLRTMSPLEEQAQCIFSHKDCFEIPFTYLPSRWHRELK
ncbi:hypothetical protein Dsin_009791 [Dipteronia sinensis]|uniref:MULE transposase domain-containing protein n=1 Tax=Dipteronia sinensis TaxID=43782 RepID=A0AAE0ARA4_9ROSI|nr:hypothetical protein Dsin_009791 [Dipteronia sinensis]